MKYTIFPIIMISAAILMACSGHSKDTPSDSATDSIIMVDSLQWAFVDETGTTRIDTLYSKVVHFISRNKLKSQGYLESIDFFFKNKNYDERNQLRIDTLHRVQDWERVWDGLTMDVYAVNDKETRCLAYIDNIDARAIVISKPADTVLNLNDLNDIVDKFFIQYENGFCDHFLLADEETCKLADKSTRHILDKMYGQFVCTNYDLPSDSGIFVNSDSTLLELRQEIARQEYIDSVAKLANYQKPTKYSELVNSFMKADPETVIFVSNYLTYKNR